MARRILFVWESLSDVGGVETLLLQCFERLPAYGFQPYALLTKAPQRHLDQYEPYVPFIIDSRLLSASNQNISRNAIARVLEHIGCELVVFSDWVDANIIDILPAHIPAIMLCNSDQGSEIYYSSASAMANRLKAIVGISHTIAGKLTESLPKDKKSIVFEINNGVVLDHRKRFRSSGEPLRLIYLGRVQQLDKRILDLIPFAQHLNAMDVPCVITIVGDGVDRQKLMHSLASLRGSVTVRFLGILSHADAMEELVRQDVLLLFSEVEGMPYSLLEALARGVVPIVSRIESGISEILTDKRNARLFKVGCPVEAAQIVKELSGAPAELEVLSAAAKHLSNAFSIDRMLSSYAALFREIINRSEAAFK